MSTAIEINGIDFVSVKDASKEVSYSRDYLSKLAREGKVNATQVGRQWFVELQSIRNFIENKNLEQEVYRRRLSEERKQEIEAREKIEEIITFKEEKIKHSAKTSVSTSFFVLGSGLAFGIALFLMANLLNINFSPNQKYSAAISANLENVDKGEEKNTTNNQTTTDLPDKKNNALGEISINYPVFSDESEMRKLTGDDLRGIFLLAREGEVIDEKNISNLFSDEVEVEFLDDNTGVISFVTEKGIETEFSFVSIPKNSEKERKIEIKEEVGESGLGSGDLVETEETVKESVQEKI